MTKMPTLFVGHGSPMNAIENNSFTKTWEEIGSSLPRPLAILSVSAHWYTHGLRVSDATQPELIYDMYGFPEDLYAVQYSASGSPRFAERTYELIGQGIRYDQSWGLDHGTWSVLCRMFPKADIPVFQLSVDRNAPAMEQYRIGQKLSALRDEGVLILGSGNVVHHLGLVNWEMEGGYPWARGFNSYLIDRMQHRQFLDVLEFQRAGDCARRAVPTPDHFFPLLPVLGASQPEDRLTVFNDQCILGSLSMTGFLFEA